MNNGGILFWQPQRDYLRSLSHTLWGKKTLVVLNYLIWFYLFYVSYRLIKTDANIFWQIAIACIIAEVIERLLKAKIFWKRPLFEHRDQIPPGLVKKWYQTGSFPSGHTSKAVFFFLFILHYHVMSPIIYLLITIPLLLFRVLVGFHYPIDMLGGLIVGISSWLVVYQLTFPRFLIESIHKIFNFVFFIH